MKSHIKKKVSSFYDHPDIRFRIKTLSFMAIHNFFFVNVNEEIMEWNDKIPIKKFHERHDHDQATATIQLNTKKIKNKNLLHHEQGHTAV